MRSKMVSFDGVEISEGALAAKGYYRKHRVWKEGDVIWCNWAGARVTVRSTTDQGRVREVNYEFHSIDGKWFVVGWDPVGALFSRNRGGVFAAAKLADFRNSDKTVDDLDTWEENDE